MPDSENPWETPGWHAIGRETALARQLIGSGVTALGRANYADKIGEYYTAFFGLSVGLERLAKLILVTDHAISNQGRMPGQELIRAFGHKLLDLVEAADHIAQSHQVRLTFPHPKNPVSTKVLECLDSFADARRGRYANFSALGDPNLGSEEPVRRWWGEVGKLILQNHYYGKQAQKRVEAHAALIDAAISPVTLVLHTDEAGDMMQDVFSASVRTGQTTIVQRYGRYYALLVVRWLADIFSSLAREASYTHHIHAFFGAWEYVQTYTVEDHFLRSRKIWPLT